MYSGQYRGKSVGSSTRTATTPASDPVTTEALEAEVAISCSLNRRANLRTPQHADPSPIGRAGWRYSLRHRKRWTNARCRPVASWSWSRFQGSGCSPVKAVRELGLERRSHCVLRSEEHTSELQSPMYL